MSGQSDTTQSTARRQRALARYNYGHFRTWHLLSDAYQTLRGAGLRPGDAAPGFSLPGAAGGSLSLRELRGRPVLLHFTSYS